MVVCVALTRFPAHTGALYAADLAGSAAGCVLTIPILDHIHAPTAVILNAGIAALAAAAFAWAFTLLRPDGLAATCCVVLLAAAAMNQSTKRIDIQWLKGAGTGTNGLYEKWNALSRILVRETGSETVWVGMVPVLLTRMRETPFFVKAVVPVPAAFQPLDIDAFRRLIHRGSSEQNNTTRGGNPSGLST